MGFIEKVKEWFKKFAGDNKGFGSTMKRMNNVQNFYGNVNRGISKDKADFFNGSYLNIEGGKGLIYGSDGGEYFFGAEQIASYVVEGTAQVSYNQKNLKAVRAQITFIDGKTARLDIIATKEPDFRSIMHLSV